MSEHQPSPDMSVSDTLPGKLLKAEREHQGLSRDEVATQLNLRPSLVDDLERDHYDQIPIAAYRRGYLRAYARLLGMDEKAVVGQYNAQFGTTEVERHPPAMSPSVRPPGKLGKYLFRLVSLLVIAGLIGLSYVWWQSGDYGRTSPSETSDAAPLSEGATDDGSPVVNADGSIELTLSQTAAAPAADDAGEASTGESVATTPGATPTTIGGDVSETGTTPADASLAADTASDTAAAGAEDTTEPQAVQEATAPAPAADPRKLTLTFNTDSWTDIRDADGKKLLYGTNPPGSSKTLEGKPPFKLTIGKSAGVVLEYMNEPVDLKSATRGTVAKLTLGE
ncbi:RodZ domain-containing protein [Cobetia marina]|uniref:RodZ domain-containing protein n=1 Tax=Cobetia marina TaxID=28258 RepID=UPI001141385C|nr:RodZ domain-containing protein [Cobetia marina]GED42033.1 helix-turn-helix domain-containing protein [Cobetia marina]